MIHGLLIALAVIVGWPLLGAAYAWAHHRQQQAKPPMPVKPGTTPPKGDEK